MGKFLSRLHKQRRCAKDGHRLQQKAGVRIYVVVANAWHTPLALPDMKRVLMINSEVHKLLFDRYAIQWTILAMLSGTDQTVPNNAGAANRDVAAAIPGKLV